MDEDRSFSKKNIAVIVLSVALIAVITVFFVQQSKYKGVVDQISKDRESVELELKSMIAGYDSLSTTNEDLNSNLEVASVRVQELLSEVENVKNASYQEISRYKEEIVTMRKIMKDFYVQIDSLNTRNQILMAENTEVKNKNKAAQKEINSLISKNTDLEGRMDLASTLIGNNLYACGIKSNGKETSLTRRSEQIKLSFTLAKNLTAKRGDRMVYMRIMTPSEYLLRSSDEDLFKYENKKIIYSASRSIVYEGEELPVTIFWNNKNLPRLEKGEYIVDLFIDQKNIGTTTFKLK